MKRSFFYEKIIVTTCLLALLFLFRGCKPEQIVPDQGYAWPDKAREYWPTVGWETAAMESHDVDGGKMAQADEFASNDALTRSLLVVKDGYIVFEKYYSGGSVTDSSNLWSVTKSFTSTLVGIVMNQGYIQNIDQLLVTFMPEYPKFANITIRHALTHSTGLTWSESGLPWVEWISSPDWIRIALDRGQVNKPGEVFKYSSANSHFLCGLIFAATGKTPGQIAEEYLFTLLGITFNRLNEIIHYTKWDEYKAPLDHSWRQDPKGLETGGFCLYLTARDMAKLGFLFINRGQWDGQSIVSAQWVEESTRDQMKDIYGRYSYGLHWWITLVDGEPGFLASGLGGQIIGVVPSLDLVVVIKYEAEDPVDPVSGSKHDDMHLFELVVRSVIR